MLGIGIAGPLPTKPFEPDLVLCYINSVLQGGETWKICCLYSLKVKFSANINMVFLISSRALHELSTSLVIYGNAVTNEPPLTTITYGLDIEV